MRRIDHLLIGSAVVLYGVGSACMVAMDTDAGEAALFGAVLVSMIACTRYVAAYLDRHSRDERSAHADTQELLHDVLVIDVQKVGLLSDVVGTLPCKVIRRSQRATSIDSGPHRMP